MTKAFDPSFGWLCSHHHQSAASSAAVTISPPQAIATHCQAAMAITINPPHTAPAHETDSAEPRAARQHAAAVVTIKLRYKKGPSRYAKAKLSDL